MSRSQRSMQRIRHLRKLLRCQKSLELVWIFLEKKRKGTLKSSLKVSVLLVLLQLLTSIIEVYVSPHLRSQKDWVWKKRNLMDPTFVICRFLTFYYDVDQLLRSGIRIQTEGRKKCSFKWLRSLRANLRSTKKNHRYQGVFWKIPLISAIFFFEVGFFRTPNMTPNISETPFFFKTCLELLKKNSPLIIPFKRFQTF